MGRRNLAFRWIGAGPLATAIACGATTPTQETAGTPARSTTIMLAEGHAFPEELTVLVGERVSFMNHDQTAYTVAQSRDCPELDVVGTLGAFEIRTTEPFMTPKTCDFQAARSQSALTGRILVR